MKPATLLKVAFASFIIAPPATQAIANDIFEPIPSTRIAIRGGPGGLDLFWDEALKLQTWTTKAVDTALQEAVKLASSSAHAIEDFKVAMDDLVEHAKTISDEVQNYMHSNKTMSDLGNALSEELGKIYQDFKSEITDPLPENHSERAQVRARMIKHIIEEIGPAYIHAMALVGVPETKSKSDFDALSLKLTHALLITGNIIDDHPKLLEVMVFTVSMLVLHEEPLRSIFNMFGFGPAGPIKGSAAAWAQKSFFGATVEAGSWFALLQKVSMTISPSWWQRIGVSAGLAALSSKIWDMFSPDSQNIQ